MTTEIEMIEGLLPAEVLCPTGSGGTVTVEENTKKKPPKDKKKKKKEVAELLLKAERKRLRKEVFMMKLHGKESSSSSTQQLNDDVRSSKESKLNELKLKITTQTTQIKANLKVKMNEKKQRNSVSESIASTSNDSGDAEGKLILQLLQMSKSKREDYLLKRAKEKKLISYNPENRSFALTHHGKRLGISIPTNRQPKVGQGSSFEELVNEVILKGIPQEEHEKYSFNVSKKNKTKLQFDQIYINQPEFISSLEKHAQYCVGQNLGIITEGELRISNTNNHNSFVQITGDTDAFIATKIGRKFALHGDIVRSFVRNEIQENSSDGVKDNSRRAFVIDVVKEVHNRQCIGMFSAKGDGHYTTFIPRDTKLPYVRINKKDGGGTVEEEIGTNLYLAKINFFTLDACYGEIIKHVGKCGELESENEGILLQNNLECKPYDEKFNEMFSGPLEITETEVKYRRDLRKECVFTIDPLTAKDLDDAMSVKHLENGNYEIGVHISDVGHFLEEDCELDLLVKERTTSVYMVQEVFHMLPKPLCFKCSLLPGEDKYAFSVFWEMTSDAQIVSTSFARTIVNSCTQFAYQHAQKIIDNENEKFDESDFPFITKGWTHDDIVFRVRILHELAQILKKKRFENGAISINRPKIWFELDPDDGKPCSYAQQVQDTANNLIEEFMLLANQSVAKFIYEKYPKISLLRNHLPPKDKLLMACKQKLAEVDLNLDTSNSKTIYGSMLNMAQKLEGQGIDSNVAHVALSHIISKPFKRATYLCSEQVEDMKDLWHYALSIPIYTHFTSPIRRYPDIVVHRLLAAALDYTAVPKSTPDDLQSISKVCNDMKYNAKLAGEHSIDLYFRYFVNMKKELQEQAVITDVQKSMCEVVLIRSGYKLQIPYSRSNLKYFKKTKDNMGYLAATENDETKLYIQLFSVIDVIVFIKNDKLFASIKTLDNDQEESSINGDNDAPIKLKVRTTRRRRYKRKDKNSPKHDEDVEKVTQLIKDL